MAYVAIPKDLNRVKTKVAFNLTRRQLIGFSIAGFLGFPTYLGMRNFVPNDVAIVFLVLVTLPVFFITMYEKDTLTFEKYFKYVYLHKFYQPGKRVRKEEYLEQVRLAKAEAGAKQKKPKKAKERTKQK